MSSTTSITSWAIIGSLIPTGTSAQSWHRLDTANTILEINVVNFLAFDPQGGLWTANEGNGDDGMGLFHYLDGTWTRYDVSDVPVLSNGVRSVAFDAEGNAWFVVYNRGLLKFDGSDWTVLDTTTSGIPSNKADVIEIDDQGNIWTGFNGMEEARLARFDGTTWTVWNSDDGPFPSDNGATWTMEFFQGDLWIGQYNSLYRLDPITFEWTEETANLPYYQPQALLNDGMGNLWIGYYGANPLEPGARAITRFDGSNWQDYYPWSQGWVLSDGFAAEVSSGIVWCGNTNGLWYFNGVQWQEYGEPLPDLMGGPHRSVAVAPNGSVWWSAYDGIWTNDDAVVAGVEDRSTPPTSCRVVPNPIAGSGRIHVDGEFNTAVILHIWDALGHLVRSSTVPPGGPYWIERGTLAPGSYAFTLGGTNDRPSRGRFMVE